MKILFLGNSHTYFNDMPHTVGELFRLCGKDSPDTVMVTHGGMTLKWHSEQPHSRFNIKYGGYDYIVLQDVAHPFIGYDALMNDAEIMRDLIAPTGSRACLYMTWASLAHPEAQSEMIKAYTDAAEKYGMMLAPVGRVWEYIRYNNSGVNLFWQDGEHASLYGSYVAACVIYCTLSGSTSLSPDMTDSFYGGYDISVCETIHKAVSTVLGK